MLLFIGWNLCICAPGRRISIHLMLLFIAQSRYKTYEVYWFQYISCYCLSFAVIVPDSRFNFISIHLMLVFIFFCYYRSSDYCHFNTSHVTVYRISANSGKPHYAISIHLMLLFIRNVINNVINLNIFQYISCYCLSSSFSVHHPFY